MGTFLVTPKMSPALAARVERAVSGSRTRVKQTNYRGSFRLSVGRIAPVLALGLVVSLFLVSRHLDEADLADRRAAILAALGPHRAAMDENSPSFLRTAEAWTAKIAGPFEGEVLAPELAQEGELDLVLARPTVYVRGTLAELSNLAKIPAAATASIKDSFLLCLLNPAPSRSPKHLLEVVRGVNFGGAVVDMRTVNVKRLFDAEAGLRILAPEWRERVQRAEKVKELAELKAELDRAPIADGIAASRADLLLVVVDEFPAGGERAESAPRDTRVALVDLTLDRILVLLRRRGSPVALSDNTRSSYARSVEGCALALDVREAAENGP